MKKTEEKEGQGNNIEEKEEKREEDKFGKETRALQVPCGAETSGYSGKKQQIECLPGNYNKYRSMKKT